MRSFPYFVASRLHDKRSSSQHFSWLISRIAVGSIALGVAVMIAAIAIFMGFTGAIQQKIVSLTAHMTVGKYIISPSQEDVPITTESDFFLAPDQVPNVSHVQRFARKAALLKTPESVYGILLKGVGTDFDTTRFAPNLVAGRFPDFRGQRYSEDVLLSRYIADKLRLEVSDRVIVSFFDAEQETFRNRKLRVCGLYETGLEDFDHLLVIGDIRLIQRINTWPDTLGGGYEVFVRDFSRLPETFHLVNDAVDFDMLPEPVTDRYVHFFDWFRMLERNVTITLVIILSVAAFNVIAIILILIMERTQMIGSLKAMGATNRLIRRIFVFKGLRLLGWGLFWGNAVGLGFCWLQQATHLLPLDPKNYYMDHVPVTLTPVSILLVNLATVGLVGLMLFLPTLIIMGISPIRAIRFD